MNNKEHYTPPLCEVIALETMGMMMAMSGYGKDSDDSEFGSPTPTSANNRRDTWGNLWETES